MAKKGNIFFIPACGLEAVTLPHTMTCGGLLDQQQVIGHTLDAARATCCLCPKARRPQNALPKATAEVSSPQPKAPPMDPFAKAVRQQQQQQQQQHVTPTPTSTLVTDPFAAAVAAAFPKTPTETPAPPAETPVVPAFEMNNTPFFLPPKWGEQETVKEESPTTSRIIVVKAPKKEPEPAQDTSAPAEEAPGDLFPIADAAATPIENSLPAALPDNAEPTIDELLPGTGGPSIFGWSAVKTAQHCLRRFYYRYVMGYGTPPIIEFDDGRVGAMPLGSCLHAMVEAYLKNNLEASAAEEAIYKVKEHYPTLAAEALRLWNYYIKGYAEKDKLLDPRAVELETRFYFTPRPINRKRRALCISARHDSVLRQMQPGDTRLPREAAAEKVWLHDLKTAGAVTEGHKTAWVHEGQVLQNLACYQRGRYVEVAPDGTETLSEKTAVERFGPADGFMVTIVGKARNHRPSDHLYRVPFRVPSELVQEYIETVGEFLYREVAPRLFATERQVARFWPKSYLCRDSATSKMCPYHALCSVGKEPLDPTALFNIDKPLDPTALELPKKKKGTRRKRKTKKAEGKDK